MQNIFNKLYRQLFYVNFRDPNIAFAVQPSKSVTQFAVMLITFTYRR